MVPRVALVMPGNADVRWRSLLFFSTVHLATGLPLHLLDLYKSSAAYGRLCLLTVARLVAVYTVVLTLVFYVPHHTPTASAIAVGAPAAVAAALHWLEYVAFLRICNNGHHPTDRLAHQGVERAVFLVCSMDPVNYVFDRTARTDKRLGYWVHVLQVLVRIGLAAVVVVVPLVWQDYERAWSCYGGHLDASDYNLGVCPAAEGGRYFQSWVCASPDNYDQAGCDGLPPPSASWAVYPPAFHVCALCTALLFGFHASTSVIDFHTRFKTVVVQIGYSEAATSV